MLFCFKKSGNLTITCLYRSAQNITHKQKNAEVSKVDYFAFLEKRSEAFRFSTLHSWKDTPPTAQLVVFVSGVISLCYKF